MPTLGLDAADAAMERYSTGDDAAFAELYDALAPSLLRFLRRSTPGEAAIEDLLQQTLLQIHRARGSFIPGAPVRPWARAIAKRLTIDGARRRRVERRLFANVSDDEAAHVSTVASAAADDVLHACRLERRVRQRLDALPEAQRTAFRLVKEEGLSLKDAAELLGTSVTAVKLRTHRAYKALRGLFRD